MSKNKELYTELFNKTKSHKEKLGDDLNAELKKNQIDIFLSTVGERITDIQKKDISDTLKRKEIKTVLDNANILWENILKEKYSIGKIFASEKMKLDKDLLIQFFDQKIEALKDEINSGKDLFIKNKHLDNELFGDGIKGKLEDSQTWDKEKLTEKIKEIELSGKITSESLDELFDDLRREVPDTEKTGLEKRIAQIKETPLYKEGVDLTRVEKQLNGYLNQINNQNKLPITLKIDISVMPGYQSSGLNEITFNTKEEALRAIYKMKLIFDNSGEYDLLSSVLGGISNFTLGLMKIPYDYMWRPLYYILKTDFNITGQSQETLVGSLLLHAGLGITGYVFLKRKLETANTGIDERNIESLKNEIKEMENRYLELGMIEESNNLKELHKKISSFKFEEKGNGTLDRYKAMKEIYIELQKFRGTPIGDMSRLVFGHIGSIFDQKQANIKFKNENGKITTLSVTKGLASLYVYPVKLATTLVNKGPNWWKIWYTKSEAILDYETEFKATNQKFKLIFEKIDEINGLTSDEKDELKKEILKKHKSDIWTAKNDPLIKIKINPKLIGPDEKISLFNKLESLLASEGKTKIINNWKSFWFNLKQLDSGKKLILKDFAKTLNPIESLGRITADTITNFIKNKPGVTVSTTFSQDIQNEINQINENAKEYMKKLPEILEAKNKFNDFIKYYPEINEKTEEKILELNKNISGTKNGKETIKKVIENINNELGTNLKEEDIKKFIKDNDIKNNIANEARFNKYTIQSTNILDKMLSKGEITQNEHIDRKAKIQDLFSVKSRTFWQPHLGLIIDNIIETGNTHNYTNKYSNVLSFKNNPNYGGGSIDSYFVEKEKIINNRDIHIEKLEKMSEKQMELLFEETTFENELKRINLELITLNTKQQTEFKDLIKDLKKGGQDAKDAKKEFIEKVKKLKKIK